MLGKYFILNSYTLIYCHCAPEKLFQQVKWYNQMWKMKWVIWYRWIHAYVSTSYLDFHIMQENTWHLGAFVHKHFISLWSNVQFNNFIGLLSRNTAVSCNNLITVVETYSGVIIYTWKFFAYNIRNVLALVSPENYLSSG